MADSPSVAHLRASLATNTSVAASAEALINQLAAKVRELLGLSDPAEKDAAIEALASELDAHNSALAEAVANTSGVDTQPDAPAPAGDDTAAGGAGDDTQEAGGA